MSALLSLSMVLTAQTEVKSKLVKVTVYPNNALVEKSVKVNLVKGENKFIITDNATTFNKDNLHFTRQEDFFITGVNLKTVNQSFNQASKDKFSANVAAQINALNDKVQQTRLKIKDNNLLINTYNQQLNALKNVKAIKNTALIDTVKTLQDQFAFQREEGIKLNALIAKAQKENEELGFTLNQQEDELEDLVKQHNGNCNLTTKSQNITISVYSNRNMTAELQYNYLVSNVASTYYYDVMLNEDLHNAVFNLKTNVEQRTNENWKNCDIVFSTSDAGTAGQDGELYTWYLNNEPLYRTSGVAHRKNAMSANNSMLAKAVTAEETALTVDLFADADYEDAAPISSVASSENLTLSKEYTLNTKQAISSGDKPQTIPLSFDTTKADFRHFSTPKNIEKVYYTALLPDWEDLGLQGVESSVFLNGKYIAKSFINTNSTKDTMQFSAGEDKGVKIARKVRKSSPDKGFLSSNVEITVTVSLNITNAKNKSVDLEVKDQIPVSQDANIKITNVETNEGNLNSNTGIIKWKLQLAPKESKQVKFSYTVKYPKEYNLNLN